MKVPKDKESTEAGKEVPKDEEAKALAAKQKEKIKANVAKQAQ